MPDRIESIFHAARHLPDAEREAYLRGACGQDLALRSKVDALLAADAEAGEFLNSATADVDVTQDYTDNTFKGSKIFFFVKNRFTGITTIECVVNGTLFISEWRPWNNSSRIGRTDQSTTCAKLPSIRTAVNCPDCQFGS